MTVKIDELVAKEDVAGVRPYDEAYFEDDCKIQTVHTVRFRICPPNPCTYEYGVGCNPEHRDYMIDLNTWLDYHWEELTIMGWAELWMIWEHSFDFQAVGNWFDEWWEGVFPYAADKGTDGGR